MSGLRPAAPRASSTTSSTASAGARCGRCRRQAIEPVLAGRARPAAGADGRRQDRGGVLPAALADADRGLARPQRRSTSARCKALLNNLADPAVGATPAWSGGASRCGTATSGDGERARIRARPAGLLLDDARVARGDADLPQRRAPRASSRTLRAVVVDEMHAFAGDDRGWHLLARARAAGAAGGQRAAADRPVGDRRQPRGRCSPGWSARQPGPTAGRGARRRAGRATPDVRVDFVGSLENAADGHLAGCTAARSGSSSATAARGSRTSRPRCASAGVADLRLAQLAQRRRAPPGRAGLRRAARTA